GLTGALLAGLAAVAVECWMVAGAFPLRAAPERQAPVLETRVETLLPHPASALPPSTGVASGVVVGVHKGTPKPMGPRLPQGPPELSGPTAIRVGGNVQQAKLVRQPTPLYPAMAKQARISGVVHLQVRIGESGAVEDIKVISGH